MSSAGESLPTERSVLIMFAEWPVAVVFRGHGPIVTNSPRRTAAGRRTKHESATLVDVDEGRKGVLLIAASILAARKLAQYDSGTRVPATIGAISDAVRWAEQIMAEIDRRWPAK